MSPVVEFGTGGLINMCPLEGCHAPIPKAAPALQIGTGTSTTDVLVVTDRAELGLPSSPPLIPVTLPPYKDGTYLLASAKDRLAAVQLELQRFAALQAEEAMLERMIAAAGELTGDAN